MRENDLISDSLQSLIIRTERFDSILDDGILEAIPNLKHISMNETACKAVNGSCFKNLHNLFSLEISKHNNLTEECVRSLGKRGIIHQIHRLKIDFKFAYFMQ
ncbi:MAG: hypothetical protein Hyperionvirus1_75 [Hyperionvirus sp.]|uniref:Uncharacterized protein n=1 Tax=Hyperionvirus sp. TaxID=2487770 RepID=A0A3G5A5I1_9VIRU|nr:MAG: hypothetical protein Hyperionvirus1_75 [Hyperionvirus sp.]